MEVRRGYARSPLFDVAWMGEAFWGLETKVETRIL